MVAYFCHEIRDNYRDYFQTTIAINESFVKIFSRQNEKIKFKETLIYDYSFSKLIFRLSPLQKHVRKVVDGFGKESCVSTGARKPGNTYASPTAMI